MFLTPGLSSSMVTGLNTAMTDSSEGSMRPYPETADIETSSDGYASRFAGPVGEWMLGVQERIALGMLADMPGAAILDVGGGHGQLAGPLCRNGYKVTVIGSHESCRRRIAALVDSGACRFEVGNVVALPFPDRSFDAAISFRLLTHCEAWPELIRELCRVARRSVIVDYPTSQSLNAVAPALFGAKKKLEGNTRQWRLFRHDEVTAEFARHGFECKRRVPQFFLPMVLHRAMRWRLWSAGKEWFCGAIGLTHRWGSPVILEMRRHP